jgi:hypothetical protein
VFCGTVIALARTIEVGGDESLSFQRVLSASKVAYSPDLCMSGMKLISSQLGFLAEMWYITTLVFLKIAIALFFYRISLERWKKIFICGIIIPLTIFSIATVVYNGFHCGVFGSFLVFLFRKIARQCAPDRVTLAITYTHAALTALTDWSFALMPIVILHGSLMSRKEKIIVGILMGFASVSGVASLIRFRYVGSIVETTETVFVATENLAIWSCIEIGVGIIAASVVCLRPLVRRVSIAYAAGSSKE